MNKFEKQLEKWNHGVLRGAQAKLAKALQVSTATTALWATGKRHPSKGYISQMASLFGLDIYGVLQLFDFPVPFAYATPNAKSGLRALRERNSSVTYPLPVAENSLQQNTVKLPFLAVVPTDYPHLHEEDILEWWSIPRRYAQGAKYIVRSKDISLPDATCEDDLCWIKPARQVSKGQWVLLINNKQMLRVGKVSLSGKKCVYQPAAASKNILDASFHPIGILVRRIKPL